MRKKGFTLIELLVVIVVLGLIIGISVSNLMKLYSNAKVNLFINEARNIYKSANNQTMIDVLENEEKTNFCYTEDVSYNPLSLSGEEKTYYSIETKNHKITKLIISTKDYSITIKNPTEVELADIMQSKVNKKGDPNYILLSNCELESYTQESCFVVEDNTITYYDEECGSDVIIPPIIKGVKITSIGEEAFFQKHLTSVKIPEGITTIEAYAFQCNDFTGELIIPDSVVTIGTASFSGFSSYELYSNSAITSVIIGNGVKTIGNNAFSVNKINSITFGSSVETIEGSAFQSNDLKETLVIPNSVKTIGSYAFSGYTSNQEAKPNTNEIKSVVFGSGIQTIEGYAFSQNKIAGNLIIPDSVNSIGNSAFKYNNITCVKMKSSGVTLGTGVFNSNGTDGSTTIIPQTDCPL